ncbi:hypothetical protein [Persicitalea jodogahamensis]|uniref:hypothetical protein n=1 Tax=Persicitalea jodogahamensis TaxID=402147 RepID=UPI0016789CBA|nr:hypothetical protein [Persicitalea jodogahamensis]
MSKRLLRLFPPFQEGLPPLLAAKINIVQRDGRTLFGHLEKLEADSLVLRDLRSHPHRVQLADVAEIIFDRKSEIFPKIDESL